MLGRAGFDLHWKNALKGFAGPVPVRDYFILPALSLATVVVILVASEVAARILWPQNEHNQCIDMSGDMHVTPNCTTRTKIAESSWTTYHFNECGYRSDTSCGAMPRGTIRIAVIGSSLALAYRVSTPQTFYSRAAEELGRLCHVPVDVQNLATLGAGPTDAERQAEQALQLHPDVVVFPVWPLDLDRPPHAAAPGQPAAAPKRRTLWERIQYAIVLSRALFMAKHLLYLNQGAFISASLKDRDKSDFMRPQPSEAWQRRYLNLKESVRNMTRTLTAAHVPLIMAAVPTRAEAALLGTTRIPPALDPLGFLGEVRTIAASQSAAFADLLPAYNHLRNPERLYFAVDGHLNEAGQTVLAKHLVAALLDDKLPVFSGCSDPRLASGG